MVFNPAAEERIEAGDRLVILAEAARLKDVEAFVGRTA
jgi:Trk K+ transport system NAD-binding subunit